MAALTQLKNYAEGAWRTAKITGETLHNTFTGSADTGRALKSHPRILEKAVPFNLEADSLNCCALGPDVMPGMPEWDLFINVTAEDEIARDFVLGMALMQGRILVLNAECAKESTSHGSPMPLLVHGGPGHAGVGEEIDGKRGEDDIAKGIVKWLVNVYDETSETVAIATILTIAKKQHQD